MGEKLIYNSGKMIQLPLKLIARSTNKMISKKTRLVELLAGDLNFHNSDSLYASHNFHSFPAKFPPQLPRVFIENLTNQNGVVLDPMMGSGTTIIETLIANRNCIGFDIDPLAILIARVKTTPVDPSEIMVITKKVISESKSLFDNGLDYLKEYYFENWDSKTRDFIDYWFDEITKYQLLSLIFFINKIQKESLKNFLKVAFSSIIITKNGGVSLALDLAHTRPHRAKYVKSQDGTVIIDKVESEQINSYTSKSIRSPFNEIEKKVINNLKGILPQSINTRSLILGNTQNSPLANNSVDLIVTSPPYASNAIDYMRAHKFSLIWFGYSIEYLSQKRDEYIGGELTKQCAFEPLPKFTESIVQEISNVDAKKGLVLRRYYSEMTRTIREMYRILKNDSAAIVVVGSSIMRNIDTQTQLCLAEIGKSSGFDVPKIGIRYIDRNRRMLPTSKKVDLESQIQKRMHEEYVIGLYKD
ncbi:hypothetical protein ADN00_14730 [Ornatilinea apprima]|uniref:Methyltransferase n=1 Tax=Ornatilinea apprima TaxID=1134406 RepID=A0A0P6XNH4_9CHLR|nr:DNA methyltransferase [Ornatilinea apprima]KPL73592.1 hypothetical protein ADN00_14730 [Ornatilinea apprima]